MKLVLLLITLIMIAAAGYVGGCFIFYREGLSQEENFVYTLDIRDQSPQGVRYLFETLLMGNRPISVLEYQDEVLYFPKEDVYKILAVYDQSYDINQNAMTDSGGSPQNVSVPQISFRAARLNSGKFGPATLLDVKPANYSLGGPSE